MGLGPREILINLGAVRPPEIRDRLGRYDPPPSASPPRRRPSVDDLTGTIPRWYEDE